MTWVEAIDAADTPANTIHTLIQNAKSMVIERMRCTDDVHDVFGETVTGRHPLVGIGWVYRDTSLLNLITWMSSNEPDTGCLVWDGTILYVSDETVVGPPPARQLATLSHAALIDIADSGHTQYTDRLGVNEATADWNLTTEGQMNVSTEGAGSGEVLLSSHHSNSWYGAHGENSVLTRHLGAGCIPWTQLYEHTYATNEGTTDTLTCFYTSSQIFASLPRNSSTIAGLGVSTTIRRSGTLTGYYFLFSSITPAQWANYLELQNDASYVS